MAIQPDLDLLTQVSQSSDSSLTISWRALPSIPRGLEPHYLYIIDIQRFTRNQWGDWAQIDTVQHRANVDVYDEVYEVELEYNTRYRVQILAERQSGNQQERVLVSQVQELKTQCRGKELIYMII